MRFYLRWIHDMLILSHPTGNANVRAAAEGFAQASILDTYYTSIACFPNTWVYNLASIGSLKEFKKRSYSSVIRPHTKLYPWDELGRLLATKLGKKNWLEHEIGHFCIDKVYQRFDQYVASQIRSRQTVYAYEDGALATFKKAKYLGNTCIYDLPIGYWRSARELMAEEIEQRPDWSSTFTGFKDSDVKLSRKDEELALADHIFVASLFTKKTLSSYPNKLDNVSVIPYGFPDPFLGRQYVSYKNRPLKLLFVGGLSQRKGIANVLEAVEKFRNKVELTIVGRKSTDDCRPLNEGLMKHRYIPSLPHSEILKLMSQHDVLLFPSLFEGFGLVITEAMSQGTPVITTERTAGPDLIEHGKNGWLVKAGDTEALRLMIESLISNAEQIERVGKAAMQTARQRPWQVYSEELATKIQPLLVNDKPS